LCPEIFHINVPNRVLTMDRLLHTSSNAEVAGVQCKPARGYLTDRFVDQVRAFNLTVRDQDGQQATPVTSITIN
jgi:hypothetical protein